MKKPNTIIYSDKLFDALAREREAPSTKGRAMGRLMPSPVLDPVEVGPLKNIENGTTTPRQEFVAKFRVGELADVVRVAQAHGPDMATYKTIVFDLDFELNEQAIARIAELNQNVTGDGKFHPPVTWATLAAQDHLILVVLSRPRNLIGSPHGQKHLSLSVPLRRRVQNSYDMISALPFRFLPINSESPSVGTVLAPDDYKLDNDLEEGIAKALKPWIEHGTAFQFLDPGHRPGGARQVSFCSTGPEGGSRTIAGSFRYEKSHVGFLPETDPKSVPWIKGISKIGFALDAARRSPTWLSKMADGSALEKIILIVRPVERPRKGNPVILSIEYNDEPFQVKVAARTGRDASNFNRDHQWLIYLSRKHGLLEIDEMIDKFKDATGERWTPTKVSQLMTALRKGIEPALAAARLPQGLAEKIFPEKKAGVSNRLLRENIRVPEPPGA